MHADMQELCLCGSVMVRAGGLHLVRGCSWWCLACRSWCGVLVCAPGSGWIGVAHGLH